MTGLVRLAAAAVAAEEAPEAPGRVTGSFGEGVTLTTPDDSLSLTVRGRVQVRSSLLVSAGDAAFVDRAVSEFVVRRARLTLAGHAFDRDLTYYVQLAFSNQDTEPDLRLPLRDAYLNWAASRDLELRVGQGKVPYGRQRITSSGSQELVDRSIVTGEFNLDRDVGLTLLSKDLGGADGRFGYALGVFGGDGRNRLGSAFGYLGVARLTVRPMGKFDDDVEADLERHDTPKLAIGGGFAWNQNTNRPRSTIDTPYETATFDYAHVGADAMLKWRGACLQGEWFLRRADRDVFPAAPGEYSRSGTGFYVQAGQMIGPRLELAARYGDIVPDEGADPDLVRARELGGGPSWYFRKHALKLQADWFWLPTGDSAAGDTFEGGNHQVRTQLQLWF